MCPLPLWHAHVAGLQQSFSAPIHGGGAFGMGGCPQHFGREDKGEREMRRVPLGLVLAGAVATTAVFAADSKDAHLQTATAAAGQDLKGILSVCDPRTGQRAPPSVVANAEPAKIFDNLYFLGIANVS